MLYRLARFFLRIFLRFLFRMEVYGIENVPVSGPLIAIANHTSMLDPIVLGCAIPRQIHFMAKQELFRNPFFARVLLAVGAFPVKRGEQDQKAFRRCLEILNAGGVLGIFPEGTRSLDGRVGKALSGAGIIALKTGAPILPVGIKGTLEVIPKTSRIPRLARIRVRIGRAIRLEGSGDTMTREEFQDINEKMMNIVRELARDAS